MRRRALGAIAAAVVAPALAGCQTTQERSAELAAKAQGAVRETRQSVGATNRTATVTKTTVVRDRNGVAVVVEVRNRGAAQADVPVALAVRGRDDKVLFRNDSGGLDPSLVAISALDADSRHAWVNDQLPVSTDEARKATARLGTARGRAPGTLPRIAVSDVRIRGDSSGLVVHGKVENLSDVPQKRLAVHCVARKGGKIVAAGRAVVDTLAKGRPAPFSVYVIGDPRGAELTLWAPPTKLGGP